MFDFLTFYIDIEQRGVRMTSRPGSHHLLIMVAAHPTLSATD
jgi:hypothetical protein